MDQHKIDRIFRERLHNHEATPSAEAWSQVEGKINSRSSFKLYWIAASVALLIVGWVVWPEVSQPVSQPIATSVDHPVLNSSIEWNIPEITRDVVVASTVEEVKNEVKVIPVKEVKENKEELPTFEKVELLDLSSSKAVVAKATIEQPKLDLDNASEVTQITEMNQALETVKITYIGANKDEITQPKDSVGAFKKIVAFAGKLSPGDVLADLKTAKDDFINGGFKSKQKDRTSL